MKWKPAEAVADVLVLLGAAAVTVGAALLSLPAGLIVGGVLLTALGLLFAAGAKTDET